MHYRLKERLMVILATWLRHNCRPYNVPQDQAEIDLYHALDTWLAARKVKDDQLMIGFVRCRKCGCRWEALAYRKTLHKLECPECSEQKSEVATIV